MFGRRRTEDPEQLIDTVIVDIRRRLTEARLQMLAADLARGHLDSESAGQSSEQSSALDALARLEGMLHELETKRNLLIARVHDADARLAVERALMENGGEPGQVALEMLADRVMDSESQAEAVAEVRRISGQGDGSV